MAGFGEQCPQNINYWYVYILRCSDKSIYTGCTNNLTNRIERHNSGQVKATRRVYPAKLITYIAFTDKYKAYNFERYLKQGSGRAFAKRHLY
jgi:predicted GIY-YIG superfamily endonuclease